ncbi:MAG: SagB/ThcOx family dehydrogenase [Thaumarchaeota archaeon]|nr:SagB/ThcOx family dehydrogenase [Nitrososphaerota archaeon]
MIAPPDSNMNGPGSKASEYHEATKHSEVSVRTSGHYLDWDNKPSPFKVYTALPLQDLPTDFLKPALNALIAISTVPKDKDSAAMGVDTLAELLFFSAGITREVKVQGRGTFYFRAAPATGALYPIELYVVCKKLEGLEAGVYHFSPGDFSLSRLRGGDWTRTLSSYAGLRPDISAAPASIVLTSMAWRNSWKYQARSYRHWFWDGGVIAANLLATASSAGLRSSVVLGFEDEAVNRLLGLRARKEAAIAICPLGMSASASGQPAGGRSPDELPPPIDPDFLPLSRTEVESPDVWEAHEASGLRDFSEVITWTKSREERAPSPTAPLSDRSYPLERTLQRPDEGPDLAQAILRRGSTRRFSPEPITYEQLSNVLYYSTRGVPLGLPSRETLLETYLISNAVKGLPNGSYRLDRASGSLEQLRSGEFRDVGGYLCLGQPLFTGASAVLFLMTELGEDLRLLGDRGYRAAQFEAGVAAGRMYLASYAQGMGASGTTFYDDQVTEFFSPSASKMTPMMALGIGVPGYRARFGRVLPKRLTREQMAAGSISR